MSYKRILNFISLPLMVAMLSTCKNVADVEPTERTTFIKLFEKGGEYAAQLAEPLEDGYLMGANLYSGLNSTAYITKLDVHGNVIWEQSIDDASVAAIKVLSDGYLILGDGIQTNDTALNINDRVITKALLTKMGTSGDIVKSVTLSDPSKPLTDFHGTGISLDLNGNILTVGNKKDSETDAFSLAYVAVYDPTTLDTLWTRPYSLIDQDFINAKNVFTSSTGNILWSNSVQKTNLSQTLSYLTIASIQPQSTFDNYSYLGQSITQNRLAAQEMQAAPFGFGIIGTFSDGQGKNGNLFFVQAGPGGQFSPSTLLFFDGVSGSVPADASSLDTAPVSVSDDVGMSLSATPDGGFLLGGTLNTTIQRGNGGLDIWLIRIDPNGKELWNKIFGGAGDETVNSIRTLSDGSFLISGASRTSFLSAAYIMRIDRNGEIKN